MNLKNKETGEIVENAYIRESHDFYNKRTIAVFVREGNRPPERVSTGYETLAELNAEWEDAPEEPKGLWAVGEFGELYEVSGLASNRIEELKEIGNCFETEEEAEKVVEKLKAWKRLKDKGLIFCGTYSKKGENIINFEFGDRPLSQVEADEAEKDLDLLFGGEE